MHDDMKSEFFEKVVLVTGAASGIGAAIASAFSAEGALVRIADVDYAAASALAASLGENTQAVILDVRHESEWQKVINDIDMSHGRLDVLVNNAGVSAMHEFEDLPLVEWQRTMEINATGVFLGCKESLKLLKKTPGSSIVNLASIHSNKVNITAMDYSASKAAVQSITESVALYCADKKYPVRCNSIKPGIIRTPMLEAALQNAPDPDGLLEVFNAQHPIGHIGTVSDVANLALFLASEKSAFITGTSVAVDGGFLAS